MERNCAYLRKSRKDDFNEPDEVTLKRHKDMLLKLADSMGKKISYFYHEVCSGESIASRKEVQNLLTDLEENMWDNVFVVEIERLARGDTMDQGYITHVFKYSRTNIITPQKVYNMADDSDEEFLEFNLFMSRREYKTINKRLNNGRIASVNEGKYVGNITPFGYNKMKLKGEKGFMLVVNPEEANTVKLVFTLYADNAEMTMNGVARELNRIGIKPRITDEWSLSSVKDMLRNEVYIGKIRWNHRKTVRKSKDGKTISSRPRNETPIIVNGLHEAIISQELWDRVQAKRSKITPRAKIDYSLKNPFAGLIKCDKCGKPMLRRPYYDDRETTLICNNSKCDNVSSKIRYVEEKILKALNDWCKDFEVDTKKINEFESTGGLLLNTIEEKQKQLKKEETRLENIYSNFEEGIYTREIFFNRKNTTDDKIKQLSNEIQALYKNLDDINLVIQKQNEFVPKVQNIIDIFYNEKISAEKKNSMLKEIVEKITYLKNDKAIKKDSDPYNFTIRIYPKLPQSTRE